MVWQWLKVIGSGAVELAKVIRNVADVVVDVLDGSERERAEIIEYRENIQLRQIQLQYLQHQDNIKLQAEIARISDSRAKELTTFIQNAENARLDKSLEFQLKQIQLQYLQHQDNIKLQAEIARISDSRAKELTTFIQNAENARLDKSLEFQKWRLEQEKELQLELLDLNHQLQRKLAIYQRQTSLKVVEEQKRLENSPIWLVASDILNSSPGDKPMPLRVFFAPPKLQFEKFASATNAATGFPDVELTLAEGLRQFFRNYSTERRQIDFLAGAWVSKSFHSEASIKALFGVLKSEPTLVLESEVDGNYLNFRIAYWGLNWLNYRYDPVISRLPYRDILFEAARTRALKWASTKAKLIATGIAPEEADQLYGKDNVTNLVTLQREEQFKKAGIEPSELGLDYTVNDKDFEELCQFLIIYHCVYAGLIADEYFLVQYNLPPLLPQLLPGLTQNVPEDQAVEEMLQGIVSYYQKIYQSLGDTRTSWIPELALDLAQSLAHLTNKSWALEQIIYSVKSWLQLHDLPQVSEFEDLVQAMKSALTITDREYVDKLNKCLAAVGKEHCLSVMDACYNRGMNRCHQEDYLSAISDFEQAIQLNPGWADAYYNRGLAHAKLQQYQEAIADYTQALEINPGWAEVYNNLGNTYYKLGQHEQAIANYNQALRINPSLAEAARNRDIAQGVFEELQRKQQEEKELQRKQQEEEELQRKQQEEEKRFDSLENISLAHTLTGHSFPVRAVAINPNGKTFFSGSVDNTIKLWQLSTGKGISTIKGHFGCVSSVAISPNGLTLASGSYDDTIKLWQISTQRELHTLAGHTGDINALAISPNGLTLASGSDDQTIKLWQMITGTEIRTLKGHSSVVYSVAISPDGEILASASAGGAIKLWQMSTGQELRTLMGHSAVVNALAISPNGQILASVSDDKTIKLWQMRTGRELCTLSGHSSRVNSVAITPNGRSIVSGSSDNTIKIWELSTGKELRTLTGHTGSVFSVAITPNGRSIISGSSDNTIKIWQVQ